VIADLKLRARYLSKVALRPLLYRHPPIGLMPERLYLWTRTLIETKDVPGAVLEIGCSAGGTAAWCDRLLRNIGTEKPYVCVDTFGGFTEEQFAVDAALGTPESVRFDFSANSLNLVRRTVAGLGAPGIRLIQGDVCTLPVERLPRSIAACLVDVDLSEPVYAALRKVYPRLAPGGIIIVDDCPDDAGWRARLGYRRFIAEQGLSERYEFGMGVVTAGPSVRPAAETASSAE
jgi:SAM-dependent methyltransferase